MPASKQRLERGNAIRDTMYAFIAANGGNARCKEVHSAVNARGFVCHARKVTYHLNILIREKRLVRTSHGNYWILAALALQKTQAKVAMTPFGTTLKGRILSAMASSGANRTRHIISLLRADGVTALDSSIASVLSELRHDGWLRQLGYGASALTDKAVAALGIKHQKEDDMDIYLGSRYKPLIMRHLRKHGNTSSGVLLKAYGDPKGIKSRAAMYSALYGLQQDGYITKPWRGMNALSGKPYRPRLMAREKTGPDGGAFTDDRSRAAALLLPIMERLQRQGPTRVMCLISAFGVRNDIPHRKVMYRAVDMLAANGYVAALWRGVYAATGKPYPGLPAPDRNARPGTMVITDQPGERYRILMMQYLLEHGKTKAKHLIREVAGLKDMAGYNAGHKTISVLKRHGYVDTAGKATYVATKKKHPLLEHLYAN